MREADRIVEQLRRAFDGDAWFGPSVREALTGVDVGIATTRPVPRGHTIEEIVLHMTAWTGEVARRLHVGIAQDPEPGDWPPGSAADEDEWRSVVEALDAANAALADAVSVLDDSQLADRIGDARDRALGSGVSTYAMLHGLIQHHAYHAGQISLLKKASGA